MPIGQTFTLGVSDTALTLNLQPSSGVFYWNGAVSNTWSDPFLNSVSNWTRQPGKDHIFGTPGAASDVIFEGNAVTLLGANFSIGSLSGTGIISLGDRTLTTGASGLSTTWAGSHRRQRQHGEDRLRGVHVVRRQCPIPARPRLPAASCSSTDGSAASSIRVLDGALLGGNGVVPTATIERGGVLAPGSSIGTLTRERRSDFRRRLDLPRRDHLEFFGLRLGRRVSARIGRDGSRAARRQPALPPDHVLRDHARAGRSGRHLHQRLLGCGVPGSVASVRLAGRPVDAAPQRC